jgi:hypothetical protein
MSHVDFHGSVIPELRDRAASRNVRIETELEVPAVHGCGEVLDVVVWGTVVRSRARPESRALETLRDLAAVACTALPAAGSGVFVETLPFERALFGPNSEAPDQVRLRFRVLGSDVEGLKAWREKLQGNLRALGIVRNGSTGAMSPLPAASPT